MSSQEQPEDPQPEDQQDVAGSETTPDAVAADDERIEQLTGRIDKARATAEDAGVLDDSDETEYVDSGTTDTDDDQTITPPG